MDNNMWVDYINLTGSAASLIGLIVSLVALAKVRNITYTLKKEKLKKELDDNNLNLASMIRNEIELITIGKTYNDVTKDHITRLCNSLKGYKSSFSPDQKRIYRRLRRHAFNNFFGNKGNILKYLGQFEGTLTPITALVEKEKQ